MSQDVAVSHRSMVPMRTQKFLQLSLGPEEIPDWDYARSQRAMLMVPSAEWCHAIASTEVEFDNIHFATPQRAFPNEGLLARTFVTPQRDFPYEGLLARSAGENWKYLDCLPVAVVHAGHHYSLIPKTVDASPWNVTYSYALAEPETGLPETGATLFVTYYLNDDKDDITTGYIQLDATDAPPRGFVIIQPLFDIRHMYDNSSPHYHVATGEQDSFQSVAASHRGHYACLFVPCGDIVFFQTPVHKPILYRLGSGSRQQQTLWCDGYPHSSTIFAPDTKTATSLFRIAIPICQLPARLYISCGGTERAFLRTPEQIGLISRDSDAHDWTSYRRISNTFNFPEGLLFRDAIYARIVGLTKFKLLMWSVERKSNVLVPPAGSWWFRTVWYRDVFEGIWNNFETLRRLPSELDNIREVVLLALEQSDRTAARIPNFLSTRQSEEMQYNTADATLLCLLVGFRYVDATKDVRVAGELAKFVLLMLDVMGREPSGEAIIAPDGHPRIDHSSGLLMSVPSHSWIDTKAQALFIGGRAFQNLPSRLSQRFLAEIYENSDVSDQFAQVVASPNFFMPEINALWIAMLQKAEASCMEFGSRLGDYGLGREMANTLIDKIANYKHNAKGSYKRIFWNELNGFLYNAVFAGGFPADSLECETAVCATALLGESLFSGGEISAVHSCALRTLSVKRRLVRYGQEVKLFGLKVRSNAVDPFYDDREYHGNVVWLRSSPYLARLLMLANDDRALTDMLLNTLDHQMTEGAVFYNSELLALPVGQNRFPDPDTMDNPVPVKNPVQFWSQWCDAFVERFERNDDSNTHNGKRERRIGHVVRILTTASEKLGSGVPPDQAGHGPDQAVPHDTGVTRREPDPVGQLVREAALKEEKISKPGLFLSWCHEDETEKQELRRYLQALHNHDYIRILIDEDLASGTNLIEAIPRLIGDAAFVIMLMTTGYLASSWIAQHELPLIERRLKMGDISVKPVIAHTCAWRLIEWLPDTLAWPKDGSPLWYEGASRAMREKQLSDLVMEIKNEAIIKNEAMKGRVMYIPETPLTQGRAI